MQTNHLGGRHRWTNDIKTDVNYTELTRNKAPRRESVVKINSELKTLISWAYTALKFINPITRHSQSNRSFSRSFNAFNLHSKGIPFEFRPVQRLSCESEWFY